MLTFFTTPNTSYNLYIIGGLATTIEIPRYYNIISLSQSILLLCHSNRSIDQYLL